MDENPNDENNENKPSSSNGTFESLSKRAKLGSEHEPAPEEAPSGPPSDGVDDITSPTLNDSESEPDLAMHESGEEEAEEEEEDSSAGSAHSDSSDDWEDLFESNDDSFHNQSSDDSRSSNNASVSIPSAFFNQPKPKHKWFAVGALDGRQRGARANLQSAEIFHRKAYGSLHFVQRLELMYKLEEHSGCVNSLNFHPDGSLLASGSDDLRVVIWDWKIGKALVTYKTKHRSNVFQSKFLPLSGDLHIVSSSRDGQVRLAQVNSDEGLKNSRLLGSHRGACHKLAVMAEQPQVILSAGEDAVVYSHDVRAPKSTKLLTVKVDKQTVPLYTIHINPIKTNEYCVAGLSAKVRVYDQRKNKQPVFTYTPFKESGRYHVTSAVYNHNGSEILASYSDDDIYLFDAQGASEMGKFMNHYRGHRNDSTIKGVNFFGPKSEYIVSGSDCGNVYFWDRHTETVVQWLRADDTGIVNCLEPHPQLPFICTSGLDWDVKVWVPSCEEDAKMDGLMNTINRNLRGQKCGDEMPDISDGQMLWMWFRHFRSENRNRRRTQRDIPGLLNETSSGSDSDSFSNSDESLDIDLLPNCSTS